MPPERFIEVVPTDLGFPEGRMVSLSAEMRILDVDSRSGAPRGLRAGARMCGWRSVRHSDFNQPFESVSGA